MIFKILENPSKSLEIQLFWDHPAAVQHVGAWSLQRSGRIPRGRRIGSQGRCRLPRVQKHVGNDARVAPAKFYEGWRSLFSPTELLQNKTTFVTIEKRQVYIQPIYGALGVF